MSAVIDPPLHEFHEARPLLADRRFATLWVAQGLAQTAQNALLFSLLVVVLNITNSSTHTSLLVLTFILPSIPLGVAVGVLLDRWRKGSVLVVTNLLRTGFCILYFFFHSNVWLLYGISLGFATSGLFFNPAVVAIIPSVVPKGRLVAANSLHNFTVTGSQLLGMVFLAPTVLKSGGAYGEEAMFLIAGAMFLIAAVLALRFTSLREERRRLPQGPLFGAMPREFRDSWRVLRQDAASFLAMTQLIMSSTLVLLFAILIPRYMEDILSLSASDAAFVFAPTGVGALIGLRFLPWFARRLGKNQVVVIGLAGLAICLTALALVKPLAEFMQLTPGPLNPEHFLGRELLRALTMFFAGPMGFSYALLNAPAQTVLHERAPEEMRGRIFATQVVSANFLSLLPVLFVGGLTDLLDGVADLPGVTLVILLIAAAVGGMAVASRVVGGVAEREEELARIQARDQALLSGSVDRDRGTR
ncbi:MAG: MFS transporter [Chloroflexi bacterium]|nr:MFS transporter [Chloroflexota bacterium]